MGRLKIGLLRGGGYRVAPNAAASEGIGPQVTQYDTPRKHRVGSGEREETPNRL